VSRNYQNKQKFPAGDSTELCSCVLQLEQVHARSEHMFSQIYAMPYKWWRNDFIRLGFRKAS